MNLTQALILMTIGPLVYVLFAWEPRPIAPAADPLAIRRLEHECEIRNELGELVEPDPIGQLGIPEVSPDQWVAVQPKTSGFRDEVVTAWQSSKPVRTPTVAARADSLCKLVDQGLITPDEADTELAAVVKRIRADQNRDHHPERI
jgi:hypothetical protein